MDQIQKSVGLNGVGTKAVNALSEDFSVFSYRENQVKKASFSRGELIEEQSEETKEKNSSLLPSVTANNFGAFLESLIFQVRECEANKLSVIAAVASYRLFCEL